MSWGDSFYRAMLLLVAASPCALAVGTPAAVLAGIGQAARNGVLIKGGVHLENLGSLNVMAFDKTGTLTEGRFQVTDVISLNGAVRRDDLAGGRRGRTAVQPSAGAGRGAGGTRSARWNCPPRRAGKRARPRCPQQRGRAAGADRLAEALR